MGTFIRLGGDGVKDCARICADYAADDTKAYFGVFEHVAGEVRCSCTHTDNGVYADDRLTIQKVQYFQTPCTEPAWALEYDAHMNLFCKPQVRIFLAP